MARKPGAPWWLRGVARRVLALPACAALAVLLLLMPVTQAAPSPAQAQIAWSIEPVPTLPLPPSSIAAAPAGDIHLIYNSYDLSHLDYVLVYASRTGGTWSQENITHCTGACAARLALAFDGQGVAHVAYYNQGSSRLWHAYRDATGWHTETVGQPFQAPSDYELALAVDGTGTPHIADFRQTSAAGAWTYSSRTPGGWQSEVVDAAGPGFGTGIISLAFDGSDRPHMSYASHQPKQGLRYAYRDGTGWHPESVDSQGSAYTGQGNSLVIDGAGQPHITYYRIADPDQIGMLNHAYKDAGGWHIETVAADTGHNYASNDLTSLALDHSGYLHIAYFVNLESVNQSQIQYAYQDAAGWHITNVATGTSADPVGREAGLALDNRDAPHIIYFDAYTYYVPTVDYARGWPGGRTYLPLIDGR
jgi:hypothetical protein